MSERIEKLWQLHQDTCIEDDGTGCKRECRVYRNLVAAYTAGRDALVDEVLRRLEHAKKYDCHRGCADNFAIEFASLKSSATRGGEG